MLGDDAEADCAFGLEAAKTVENGCDAPVTIGVDEEPSGITLELPAAVVFEISI